MNDAEHNPDGLTPEQYGAPEFRLLNVGESIIDGDELWHDNEWKLTQLGGRFTVKEVYEAYRRRVSPTPADQSARIAELERGEQILWQQLAERDEVNAQLRARIAELERRVEDLERERKESNAIIHIQHEAIKLSEERGIAKAREEIREAFPDNAPCRHPEETGVSIEDDIRDLVRYNVRDRAELSQLRAQVETLTRERDEARAEVAQNEYCRKALLARITIEEEKAIIAERDSLRAQLAEREEDRVLLDPHARDILTIIAQDVECYCCTDGVPTKQPCGSCLAKAAIRAARAQEDGK